jgi:hypothetical protein
MRRPSLDDEQARSARRRRPAPSRFADATVDKATRLGAEVPEGVVACPVVWRPWAGRLADWARNGDGQCRPRSHRQLAHGINSPVPATWKDPGCAHLPAPMADVAAGAAAGGCRLHQQQAGPPTTAAGHRQTGPKQHQQRAGRGQVERCGTPAARVLGWSGDGAGDDRPTAPRPGWVRDPARRAGDG